MLRLCDGKVTFFQRKKVTFFYVPVTLCIEAGECFPAFKQQNILGSPSGELLEGLVQANLLFKEGYAEAMYKKSCGSRLCDLISVSLRATTKRGGS